MITTLYPNPANDVLWLRVQDAEACTLKVTVFDALGAFCHSCELIPDCEHLTTIPVDNLPDGAYYLQMENGSHDCMKPFMVVH
jgi:hypothetical protein